MTDDNLYEDLKPNMTDDEKKRYLVRVLNDYTDLRPEAENEQPFYIDNYEGAEFDYISYLDPYDSYHRINRYSDEFAGFQENKEFQRISGNIADVVDDGDTAYYVKDEQGKWYAKEVPVFTYRDLPKTTEELESEFGFKINYATDYRGYVNIRMNELNQKINGLENIPEINTPQEQSSDSVEQTYSLENKFYFRNIRSRKREMNSIRKIYFGHHQGKIYNIDSYLKGLFLETNITQEQSSNSPENTSQEQAESTQTKELFNNNEDEDYDDEEFFHCIRKRDVKNKLAQETYGGSEKDISVAKILTVENIQSTADKAIALYAQGKTDEADKLIPDFSENYGDEIVVQNNGNIYIDTDTYEELCDDTKQNIYDNLIYKPYKFKKYEEAFKTGNVDLDEQTDYNLAILTEFAIRNHAKIEKNPSILEKLTPEQKSSYEQSYELIKQLREELEKGSDEETKLILDHVKNLSNEELAQISMSPLSDLSDDELKRIAEKSGKNDVDIKNFRKLIENPRKLGNIIFEQTSDENLRNTLKSQAAQANEEAQVAANEPSQAMSPEELKKNLKEAAANQEASSAEVKETTAGNAQNNQPNTITSENVSDEQMGKTADSIPQQQAESEAKDNQTSKPLTKAEYIQQLRGITPTMHKPTTQRNVNTAMFQKSYRGRE